ncbi:HAD family hydrolase [Paenibacillus sp. OV219]|uniref:HAD family hydrolase n=1 Tax=Paenibacillus sp. OV219 TaxID=1884377 RepID=UPI0008B1170C|nr:HAD family hydrolase [Paenibacillus sp. OV219]SEO33844.1 phosphoglycolate phosphatase [Paenibacillus sp. OV219]
MANLTAAGVTYPIKAILFDKDGTLIDFIYTWGKWSEHMFAEFANQLKARELPPISADIATLWGTRQDGDAIVDYDRNGPLAMGTIEDLAAILAWQGYLAGMSWAEAKIAVQQCRQHADQQLEAARASKALPGVVEFLAQCREQGLKLAVVTADETAPAVKHLKWLGLDSYFDAIIGTDRVERGKPFPDMALLACRELDIQPSEAAVIGDTNGDMRMADLAGAAVAIGIAPTSGAAAASKLPDADAIIITYDELRFAHDADER